MYASSTGSPSPSVTVPHTRTASGSAGDTSSAPPTCGSPIAKKGPTVWDGVGISAMSVHHRGGVAPAQNDVEPIGERPLLNRLVEDERGEHQVAVLHTVGGQGERDLEEERGRG